MRESVRAYLTAGFSTVAVGAIIAAPMNQMSLRVTSTQPQVRINDVQLAAATTPLTPRRIADQPAAVHVLAEVSRGLESTKAANSASDPVMSSAAPARAQLKTGAVRAQDPVTTPAPATGDHQSSTAPRRAAVNAIDPPGIANVLAQAAQLALDAVIAEPAFFVGQTVFSVDTFLVDVATLDPDTVSAAFQNFVDDESDSIKDDFNDLTADAQGLQDAIGHLFGVGDNVTAMKLTKTTTPAAKAGAVKSGAAESAATHDAAPKKQRGHVVAGKGAQHEATGSAQDASPAGVKDGAIKTGKPADTTSDTVSDSKHTTAEPTATSSTTNTSDTKPGRASEPKHTKKADNPTKKAAHTGDQSAGNASKSTGNASKSGAAKHAKHAKHHG